MRMRSEQWVHYLVGVEAMHQNLSSVQLSLYDKIVKGTIEDNIPFLECENWDLVIFGDSLEHLPKDKGFEILRRLSRVTKRFFVQIPIWENLKEVNAQTKKDGWLDVSPLEEHKSSWSPSDFKDNFNVESESIWTNKGYGWVDGLSEEIRWACYQTVFSK